MPLYVLWIKPSGEVFQTLSQTIRKLATELDTVVFEPHVTLLANLDGSEQELAERGEELAGQIKPFKIFLTEPAYQDEYFKCVFLRVEKTQSVMNANACAARIFKRPQEIYEPHVSLAYGNLLEECKKRIIRDLPGDLKSDFEAKTIYLVRADSPHPKDWHELAAFHLEG
ncbi:MAG: 2'-5' RNA ligase family protein [Candidatus Acidiferrum sp.]